MGHQFAKLAFTESVREVQAALGSRAGYAAMDEGEVRNHILTDREASFITARDSFYMASVSETGWPYVQHRGGPAGFVRVLDNRTIGFADFSGNRQYVSVGNVKKDDRVSLFFMDYPNQRRLKLLGRVRLIELDDRRLDGLQPTDYQARVERGFVIEVEAFDWNCPQHITPRFTTTQIQELAPASTLERATERVLGDGPLQLVVSGMRLLTPRVRGFELRDPAGAELPVVEAGAHLRIPVRLPDGSTTLRHYSICSSPARRDAYEIAVLREDEGAGGSRAVHEQFELGLRLRCELPENHFPLHAGPRPAVLIAGGIGITPIRSMAQALRARGDAVQVHYAGRNQFEMAFYDQLQREFGNDLTVYRSNDGERMDLHEVLSAAADDAIVYVCGPSRLIDAVVDMANALHMDPQRIRFERFEAGIDPGAVAIEVELRRSGKELHVKADQTLLDAMLEAGIDAPFSCKAGNCRTCVVKVLEGEPVHRDSVLSSTEREEDRLICPCVSRAEDRLVLDI